jgi:protein SCO1/2
MMRAVASILALAVLLSAETALAELPEAPSPVILPAIARDIDLDEHLGRAIDKRLRFTDSQGQGVTLGDSFRDGKPVILSLFYYRCPMLCGLLLEGLVKGLRGLDYRLGEEYRVVTVSFDPRDLPADAARKQQSVLAGLGRPEAAAAWPFLVGERRQSEALADRVGFKYAYDPASDQFAHPAALFVLTPEGRISRYLYGVDFTPRDLRLALLEAGEGRTGTLVDRLILTCYRYDPASRKYGAFIVGFIRLGGALTVLCVGTILVFLFALEGRKRKRKLRELAPETPKEAPRE